MRYRTPVERRLKREKIDAQVGRRDRCPKCGGRWGQHFETCPRFVRWDKR